MFDFIRDLIQPRIKAEERLFKESKKLTKEQILEISKKIIDDCEEEIGHLHRRLDFVSANNRELRNDKKFLQGTIQSLLTPKQTCCSNKEEK